MSAKYVSAIRTSGLTPQNAEYIDQLFEAFKRDPNSVPVEWKYYFYGFDNAQRASFAEDFGLNAAPFERIGSKEITGAAERLISAYRYLGHLYGRVDPLSAATVAKPDELNPAYYGLDEAAMKMEIDHVSIDPINKRSIGDIVEILEAVYCGALTTEYQYITDPEQRRWIEQRLESTHGDWQGQLDPAYRIGILKDLTAAEGLEQYLHRKYIGQKRFSLEGGDTLIPLLDEVVQRGGAQGISHIVLGMAHRGRLNVLINLMGKSPQDLFAEFEGRYEADHFSGSGDVKYHQGFYSNIRTPGGPVHVSLAFNPSHLEIVSPVVEGGVRARQDKLGETGKEKVLPVLIHGDAAFIGQGVTTETLNLSKTPGYRTGGTLHVVVNNQIGFTTSLPLEARSTLYCTDVAKLVQAPVFHVNGDDPDAVVFVTQLALDYRNTFNNDVVIDLVCYRRQGHNEADEPMVTQPGMYRKIRELETTRAIYARRLMRQQVIDMGYPERLSDEYRKTLESGSVTVMEYLDGSRSGYDSNDWHRFIGADPKARAEVPVALSRLVELGEKTTAVPEGFALHARAQKVLDSRRKMAQGEQPLDWGMAENLAFATLLDEGASVRLSGQDCGRGTFAHRHAVLHDQERDERFIPLTQINAESRFEVINSMLSELAVLAFEYGYATSSPNTLVIWEAQFGDFANCAQVVIDQFISSGYLKWGRFCQLTLFLPHGFEGQGPEHSSARLERFLQLCAEMNMRVWNPTTPAQLFHLLRDQYHRDFRRPLVVMTPKSLLRHPLAVSSLRELADDRLKLIIDEVDAIVDSRVRRVVLCSGKVYYDLLKARREKAIDDIALLRVEQLYPFPRRTLKALLEGYSALTELVWCQEEPRNQGAWYQIQHHLRVSKPRQVALGYAGRAPSASPACGNGRLHQIQQQELIDRALSAPLVDDPGERLEDRDIH